jgi:isoleucyl-tRNA synthetase
MDYKSTLNLPQTDFPIRANLKQVEEECLNKWDKEDTYHEMGKKAESGEQKAEHRYILHDGPPYPNGDIHLGHALNKVLKDIIVKYKSMSGYFAPYVPGWDCHGLPIETQLIKEIGDKRRDMSITEFRHRCRDYALKYVELQKKEFIRLGVFGEWDKPYLTINHEYEDGIIRLFGVLAEKGYIYRGLKPIHWCPHCETALAEAEIEYEDEKSPSIYVKFKVSRDQGSKGSRDWMPRTLDASMPVFFVIWTTTPWTLPANVAIAAHPEYEYVFVNVQCPMSNDKCRNEIYIIAEGLLEDFVKKIGIADYQVVGKTKGKFLEGMVGRHPFIERDSMLVLDEYVTLEQGTGLVHIAPGHGEEDYKVGLKYKLPIVMPVDEKGHFDQTVPEFIRGKYYDASNKIITEKMKEDGSLLKLEFMKHPYPHCWRCKKPVIFRATEQWFVAVDHKNMRQEALKAIGDTKWYPAWGENRIRGMVETRPDWCISRQRSWGVPIPVFYCKKCKKPQMTGEFNQAIRAMVRQEGTNAWFEKSAAEILPKGTKCPDCGYTYGTAKAHCMQCGTRCDWIELPQVARIHTFTVCNYGSEEFLKETPYVLVLVEWDKVDTLFLGRLVGVDPKEMSLDWVGKKIKAQFKRNAKMRPTDVYFVPAE